MKILVWLVLLPAVTVAENEENEVAEIRSLHVVSDIRYRFARTRVVSRLANPFPSSAEAVFHVTLPNTAFITDFTLALGTRMYNGEVKERGYAERQYKEAKEKGEPAGIISQIPKETNTFKMVLFVPSSTKLTFNLTYEEVLQRQQGLYKHHIYIDPGQPVPDMKIDVALQESRDISTLKTPLRSGNLVTDVDIAGDSNLIVVQRPTSRSAYIRFHPTLDQQLARWSEGISGVFTVLYDVERGFDAGDVLVSNGYFIHFFAPAVPSPVPKDVLFILDTSTSMFKNKLDQLKAAMKVILNELNPDDRFNIISFGSRVVFWQDDMAEAKQTTNIQRAIGFLDGLKALGWTNIKKSIETGVQYLNDNSRSAEGSLMIFLTDGRATAGETAPPAILQIVRTTNSKDIPLYTIAFGKDADWDLVKKLAIQNFGIGRRIYTDGNAAQQIEDFYNAVANTMLHGVTFKYSDQIDTDYLTTTTFSNYIEGSELIVSGRVGTDNNIATRVLATSSSGGIDLKPSRIVVDLEAEFQNLTSLFQHSDLDQMTKRMWAYLYTKEVLRASIGEPDEDKKRALEEKILRLSLEHKLVTGMTAMVVRASNSQVEYQEDEDMFYSQKTEFTTPAPYRTRPPRHYYGGGGGGGGYSRGGGGGDPHFMVYMEGLKYPICFDLTGDDNQIYQFVNDPKTGLTINVRIGKGKKHKHNGSYRTYMTEFAIMWNDLHILVTRSNITIHGVNYSWERNYNGTIPGARFFIKNTNSRLSRVSVVFDNRLQVDVSNHVHKDSDALGGNFLNIEMGNSELLSEETDGILGQFMHKKIRLQDTTFKYGHLVGHLRSRAGLVKKHGRARIAHRRDPIWGKMVSCWMLRDMGASLLDAPVEFYIVDDMFETTLE